MLNTIDFKALGLRALEQGVTVEQAVVDVLDRAEKLVEQHWVKRAYFRTDDGVVLDDINPWSTEITGETLIPNYRRHLTGCCLAGALRLSHHELVEPSKDLDDLYDRVIRLITEAILADPAVERVPQFARNWYSDSIGDNPDTLILNGENVITRFNDHSETEQADVLRVIRRAKETASQLALPGVSL